MRTVTAVCCALNVVMCLVTAVRTAESLGEVPQWLTWLGVFATAWAAFVAALCFRVVVSK